MKTLISIVCVAGMIFGVMQQINPVAAANLASTIQHITSVVLSVL